MPDSHQEVFTPAALGREAGTRNDARKTAVVASHRGFESHLLRGEIAVGSMAYQLGCSTEWLKAWSKPR